MQQKRGAVDENHDLSRLSLKLEVVALVSAAQFGCRLVENIPLAISWCV
jgi:hypothetical protein